MLSLHLLFAILGCDHGVVSVDGSVRQTETVEQTSLSTSSTTSTTTDETPTTTTVTNTTATDPTGSINDVLAWIDTMPTVVHLQWFVTEAAQTWVEFRPLGESEWRITPLQDTSESASTALLGLPEQREIEFKVVAEFGPDRIETSVATITTNAFAGDIPLPTVLSHNPELAHDSGWVMGGLATSSFDWFIYICDRDGNLVWYHELPYYHWGLYVRPSVNADTILFSDSPAWGFGADVASVVEVSLDGSIWETHYTPDQNHAFASVPDGLIWPEMDGNVEHLVQQTNGEAIEEVWNAYEWFSEVGTKAKNASNALYWHQPADTLLFSWYNRHSIIEVDRGTGEVERVFGQLPGAYSFDPPGSRFSYQHHPTYTTDGHLLVTSTPYPPDWNDETLIREYEVDDATKTLRQVWSYGEGTGMLAEQIGEATRLDNGNTIINYGTDPRIREVTAAGEVVWEAKWFTGGWMGSTLLLEDLYDFCNDC